MTTHDDHPDSPVGEPPSHPPTQPVRHEPTVPLPRTGAGVFPPPPPGWQAPEALVPGGYAAPPPPQQAPQPLSGPTAAPMPTATGWSPGPAAPGPHAPTLPGSPAHPQRPAARGHTLGLLAAVAVIGLLAGLVGGGLGSLLADRLTSVTQGGSPVPAPLPGATARPDGSIAKIAATALPSVVTVKISTGGTSGNGSGFVIDSAGHIVTNNHVVSGATGTGEITVELVDGTSLPATIVGRDASYDLAVLKVERTDLPPLTWGRSTDVVVGDGVIAVGAPLGLEATVTSGIVSALGRPVAAGGGDETSFINAIQTDAAINPGNSGGPLLDMSGRVVGVNSAIARDPGSTSGVSGSIGVGFAIPSDQAAKTAQQLIKTGKAQHPVIGVRLDRSFDGDGARITSPGGVTDGSAAQTAGLRDGDVVVSFEGKRVTGPDQLVVAIRARDVGDTVRLTVERDGSTTVITLTLQASD
ncbi:MAG: trypsin-like peptidase domain-containing protein [Actinomycetales bacterium]|nr:trypsin-like peptidase domain-containing protein [Actinomycetales bacterium]